MMSDMTRERINCNLSKHLFQEKETAPPPRTGGGLISSGTIRFCPVCWDWWLWRDFDKRGVKVVKNGCKSFDANYSSDIVDKCPITREEEDSLGRKVNLRRKEEAAISELSIGTIIVLALLGLSLIACGILCTLKRCGPPAQVSTWSSTVTKCHWQW